MTATAYPRPRPESRSGGRARAGRKLGERLAPYLFLSPVLVLFVVFIGGPFVAAIGLSFFSWDLLTEAHFTGLDNFRRLLSDPKVFHAITNTFAFALASVVLHIGIGLPLAVGVNRKINGGLKYFLRTAYFFPLLISWGAVALLWKYVLDPNFGIAEHYLAQIGIPTTNWLTSTVTALPTLIVVDLWHTLGFVFVILLAGLQAIPRQLYEASRVDGASVWSRFWHVTMPGLSPTLFFATIIVFIGAFQIFEPMFIMTEGGPLDSTQSIVLYTYQSAFNNYEVGYGATLTLVIFIVLMLVTLLQFRLGRKWVTYQ